MVLSFFGARVAAQLLGDLLQAVLIDGVHGNLRGARDCARGGYRERGVRCCVTTTTAYQVSWRK